MRRACDGIVAAPPSAAAATSLAASSAAVVLAYCRCRCCGGSGSCASLFPETESRRRGGRDTSLEGVTGADGCEGDEGGRAWRTGVVGTGVCLWVNFLPWCDPGMRSVRAGCSGGCGGPRGGGDVYGDGGGRGCLEGRGSRLAIHGQGKVGAKDELRGDVIAEGAFELVHFDSAFCGWGELAVRVGVLVVVLVLVGVGLRVGVRDVDGWIDESCSVGVVVGSRDGVAA